MSSRSRTITRLTAVAAVLLVAAPLLATGAHSADAVRLPDDFQAVASAAGLSIVSYKDPNPLPVGPGAFLTFETPEVEGELTADSSRARASLLYPGPAAAGYAALLCTAGATPFCGQGPPPVLVEANYPQHSDASLATNAIALRDPSSPMTAGAGSGEAHTAAQSSSSTTALGAYRLAAPDPARKAILDALKATLGALPGAKLAGDDALVAIGGGTATQKVLPAGNGEVRTQAEAVLHDVTLLAGAVTIHAIKVTSSAVTDGRTVHDATSSTDTTGVLVAGFPASIGPDGIEVDGQGDHGQTRQALNSVAARVSAAVHLAVSKLSMSIRDGAASRADDRTSAAADGLQLSLGNARLTDTSPPQVSALCTVTDQVQGPLSSGGLSLPPLCAVPDVTGSKDTYTFQLGRASVLLTAQNYGDLAADVGGVGGVAGDALGSTAGDAGGALGSTAGDLGGTALPGGSAHRSVGTIGGARPASFLAREARWLGDAHGRLALFELAFGAAALALLVLSKVVLRATSRPGGRSSP